jgi:hypothetical protein
MGGIFVAEKGKSFVVFVLLDIAERSQVSGRGVPCCQIRPLQETLGACEVARGEVDLG